MLRGLILAKQTSYWVILGGYKMVNEDRIRRTVMLLTVLCVHNLKNRAKYYLIDH